VAVVVELEMVEALGTPLETEALVVLAVVLQWVILVLSNLVVQERQTKAMQADWG
jgi:hypothetical protein